MKKLKNTLMLGCLAVLAASCTKNIDQDPTDSQAKKANAFVYDQLTQQIAKMDAASDQSGLTALVLGSGSGRAWEELDAYYQKVDALSYSEDIKQALKEKAIFGLVETYHFLDKAPLEKRTYYADQLFAQQHIDPNLAVAFLENLHGQWSTKKLAAAKQKTSQQLQDRLARTTRKLPGSPLLPNTAEVRKALAGAEKQQQARAQKLQQPQQRLAVL